MLIDLYSIWPRPTTRGKNSAGAVRFLVRPPVPPPKVYTADDEIVPQPVTVVEDDFWSVGLYTSYANRQIRIDSDEELSFLYIDEDHFTLPQFCQLVQNRQPVTDADENHAAPLGGFRIDEDYWASGLCTLYVNSKPVLDTDELVFVAPSLNVDEEQWDQPRIQVLPSSRLVVLDTEEDHAGLLGGFRLDEDYWQQPGSLPLVTNRQPATDTEELSIIVSLTGNPGGYVQFLVRQSVRAIQPVIDTDELFTPPTPFGLDEDAWILQLTQPYVRPRVAIGHEELAPRGLEEYEWDQPRYIPFTINRQPVIESTEEWVAPFGRDDEYWQRPQHQAYSINQLAEKIIGTENDAWVPFSAPVGIYREIIVRGNRNSGMDDYMESWFG